MDSLRGDEKDERFRAEYRAARSAARVAAAVLVAALRSRSPLPVVADRAYEAQLAVARLHTAARCILSPP